jgi:phage protein D
MSGIFSPRPIIHLDGGPSPLTPQMTSLVVALRASAPGNQAEIALDDSLGTLVLPRRDAAIGVGFELPGDQAIEVFRGRVAGVVAIGGESGRALALACQGARSVRPAAATPLVVRAGQNLVSWRIAARPASSGGRLDDLTLTLEPSLRPGMTVTIQGVRAEADGDYRIATVTHHFDSGSGFKTELKVRRTTN